MARKRGMATGVEVARISVKVSPDTKQFRRDLQQELDEIERTMKGDVEVKAHLDSAQARADFERMKQQMNKNGRVRIGVDVDPKDTKSATDEIDKATNKIAALGGRKKSSFFPSFGTGINPAGYAVIAGLLLNVLAPAVGIVTAGLMALPGILTTIIAPIGTVALGMKGIADAAAEAGLTDRVTGKKGKVKTTVGEAIKELQDAVSGSFRTNLVPVFQQLIGFLQEPALKSGFVAIADGVSSIGASLVNAISQGQGLTSITNAFTNIGNALTKMSPGFADFTTGLAQLIEQFTGGPLNSFSEWFNGAGASFKNWIAEISANGKLDAAFKGLGDTLKIVADLLGQLGQKGIDFISNPENMQTFISELQQVAQLLERIMDASAGLNRFLSKFSWMGDIVNALSSNEGDKPMSQQSVGYQLGGSLGHNFQQQIKAAFGDEGAKRYLDEFYADAEAKSAETGAKIGANLTPKIQGAGATAYASAKGTDMLGGGAFGVEPPDTTAAMAAIEKYKNDATVAINAVRDALKDIGNVQAPDLTGFAAAFDGIPDVARGAMDRVTGEIEAGGNRAKAAMSAINFREPIDQAAGGMMDAGKQMMVGLALGIGAGGSVAVSAAAKVARDALAAAKNELGIKSPSKKFMEVGQYSMEGMAVGMQNGVQPVIDQAKDLAGKVAQAFADGTDPTAAIAGYTTKEVSGIQKALNFESKRLGLQAKGLEYQAKMAGKGAFADELKARAEAIKLQKEGIDYQREMLDLTKEYGQTEAKTSSNPFVAAIQELMKIPSAGIDAFGQQAMQDLGIGGNGLLPTVANTALDWGSKFIFNVANMDEALSAQQTLTNRQAQGVVGR